MSSKRAVRRKSCGRKQRMTKEQAKISSTGAPSMTAYQCSFCGGWHVGHTSKKKWKKHLRNNG